MKPIFMALLTIAFLVGCESKKTCPLCLGQGEIPNWGTCKACNGEKELSEEKFEKVNDILTKIRQNGTPSSGGYNSPAGGNQVTCPMCSGTGTFYDGNVSGICSPCNGCGYMPADKAAALRQSLQQIDRLTGGGGYGGTSIEYGNGGSSPESPAVDNSCRTCGGTGHCRHCLGVGLSEYEGMYGTSGGVDKCPICKGTGKCDVCYGRGKI